MPRPQTHPTADEHDEAVERWLREEVVPAYDAARADPERARPVAEVFAEIRTRHLARSEEAPEPS